MINTIRILILIMVFIFHKDFKGTKSVEVFYSFKIVWLSKSLFNFRLISDWRRQSQWWPIYYIG